jgi:hypothetical protein
MEVIVFASVGSVAWADVCSASRKQRAVRIPRLSFSFDMVDALNWRMAAAACDSPLVLDSHDWGISPFPIVQVVHIHPQCCIDESRTLSSRVDLCAVRLLWLVGNLADWLEAFQRT